MCHYVPFVNSSLVRSCIIGILFSGVCICVWQSAELARAMSDISALTASATASIAKLQVTDIIFFSEFTHPTFTVTNIYGLSKVTSNLTSRLHLIRLVYCRWSTRMIRLMC